MPPKSKRRFHKLEDSALYKVTSKKKLAQVLLCSLEQLKTILNLSTRYKHRWKPKNSNTKPWLTQPPPAEEAENYRPIDIPVDPLKKLQTRIAHLLSRIEPPPYLFSPVKGLSYVDNAKRHIASRAFWLLDIADYFPSCKASRVAWFFGTQMKCAPDVTAILVALTTEKQRLPQGSPCSPILAYYSNSQMWAEIAGVVQASNCVLSVYADDITISGATVPGSLAWQVKNILHRNGFRHRPDKEVSLFGVAADITGVIVRNGQLKLPNRQHKKISELIELKRLSPGTVDLTRLTCKINGALSQRKQIEAANS